MGCDCKTVETLVKSSLAPMFKYRNLKVLSWQGYNILGDRDGTTSGPDFTNAFSDALKRQGLSVAINDQFKGVELVRRYGDPANGCHSVQIEIDRGLYMDEWKMTRKPGFQALRETLDKVLAELADYVRSEIA